MQSNKLTFIRALEIFARTLRERHCCEQILATTSIYHTAVYKKKTGVHKAWSRKLVATNQFTSGKSRNKLVANNNWLTVHCRL